MSFIGSMIGTALAETALGAALAEGVGATAASAITGAIGQGVAGAGIGALGSAAMGQDPGQGALMGGVTGGILGGVGGLGSALNAAEATTEAANLGAGGTNISGQTLTGAAGTPAQGVTGISSPVASTNPASSMFDSMSSAPTQFAATNAAQQSAVIPQGGIFANNGALSGVGDLAQKYANAGTLTKAGIGLGVGLGTNALLPAEAPTLPTKPQQKSQFSWGGPNYTYDPSTYTPNTPSWSIYRPQYYAAGGITDLDGYMSQAQNTPTSGIAQIPNPAEVADPEGYGQESMRMMAQGGVADLGGYAAGGRPNLLHGPGDGVSDDIPASIAGKQPARLAQGEYVIPSRIVSELGNGSTDAGAARLDEMVQKVNAGRAKTLGGKKYAKDTKAYKHLPA